MNVGPRSTDWNSIVQPGPSPGNLHLLSNNFKAVITNYGEKPSKNSSWPEEAGQYEGASLRAMLSTRENIKHNSLGVFCG